VGRTMRVDTKMHRIAVREFSTFSRSRLEGMSKAADDVLEALRVMGKAGANPVSQVLRHQGEFLEFDHYPTGDVYDGETGSQYYYHAHRPEIGEHGHFHTFIRAKGIPAGIEPAAYYGDAARPLGENAICHLIAVSMNRPGLPVGLFSTNRWVTGETFYPVGGVIRMLNCFDIDHVYPCLAVNRWLSALLRLFRPQIETLLVERDETIRKWRLRHPERDVFEDRELEIASEIPIDIDEQAARVDAALKLRRRTFHLSKPLR